MGTGGTKEFSNSDIADFIIKALDMDSGFITYVKDRPGHDRRYAIDTSKIRKELNSRGILVKADSIKVIAEEAPGAYKDIDQVVQVSHDLGIVEKVLRLAPIGVVKG